MDSPELQRLGQKVKLKRTELGLTLARACERAGITLTSWRRVELGLPTYPKTWRGVERALRWPDYTIETQLFGPKKPETMRALIEPDPTDLSETAELKTQLRLLLGLDR
ncbi:hypothetical protein ACWIG4_30225 [Streptomyces sp. NPDC002248]